MKIKILNINQYSLEREIEISKSSIFGFCMIDENIFLTGDNNGAIIQWKIEGNNIVVISKKEKAHFILFCAHLIVTLHQIIQIWQRKKN